MMPFWKSRWARWRFSGVLEEGKLAFPMTGSHRRVCLSDVLAYQPKRDRARLAAIQRLAQEDVAAGDSLCWRGMSGCQRGTRYIWR
jgi:hypothetical protein